MVRAIRYTAPLKEVKDYIVFDTETTGVDPKEDKIIEIGLLEVRNNDIVDRFGSFVNPERRIPAAASNVNHIYDKDVADAPTYQQIAPVLAQWLLGKTVIAHNAPFDMQLAVSLLNEFNYTGVIRYIDTLYYARRTIHGIENYKLQTLAAFFGIDPGDAHHAVDDTVTCHYLFQKCKELTIDDDFAQKPKAIDDSQFVYAREISPSKTVPNGGPLYFKRVAFTGDFSDSRRALMQLAADAGAVLQDRVTLETDYLIEGIQDPNIVGKTGKSRKQLRAAEINQKENGRIKIISEAQLKQMCGELSSSSDYTPSVPAETKQMGKPKSIGALIAKIAFGLLFFFTAFGMDSAGAAITGIVIGLGLIAWAIVPLIQEKMAKNKAAEEAAFRAAAQKERARILAERALNEPKICPYCGATTKGSKCEYCDQPLPSTDKLP